MYVNNQYEKPETLLDCKCTLVSLCTKVKTDEIIYNNLFNIHNDQ